MKSKQTFLTAEELVGIVDQRFPALVLYARCWNVNAAEDLVQEALMKLIQQPKRPVNHGAWLCKTIRNAAVSRHRKTERQRKHETEAARQKPNWFMPNDTFLAKEAEEMLDELPTDHREIVVLRIWNGLTFDEIAELTGTPKTSVFRIYTETLLELKKKLS
jgi:RNA polymerase sigma-70 factor (ECF subfamily)